MILRLWSKVTHSAEIIAAIILAAIFITFLLQIFTLCAQNCLACAGGTDPALDAISGANRMDSEPHITPLGMADFL